MAVSIVSGNYAILDKIGVDPVQKTALQEKGIKVLVGWSELKFCAPVSGGSPGTGSILAVATLSKSTNDIMKGMVSASILMGIRSTVKDAIDKALASKDLSPYGPSVVGSLLKEVANKPAFVNEILESTPKKAYMSGLTTKKTTVPKYLDLTDILEDSDAVAIKKTQSTKAPKNAGMESVVNEPKVKLDKAERLYQPVFGTSQDARYFVIALSDGLNLAAKLEGHNVSIRAEGPKVNEVKVQSALNQAGIQSKPGYASGHFTCNNTTQERLIGAVLASTGIEFTTPVPNIQKLKKVISG